MNISLPLTSEQLYDMLDQAEINYRVLHHAPLMTVEDARAIRGEDETEEGQIKNLFLKNKKGKMWLLTLHEDREINLKQAAIDIGAKRFSFCSAERLMTYLGVVPGAVSPFGLLNDHNREVTFYIDETLLEHQEVHAHPMDNRITVSIGTRDLLRFLDEHGYPHEVLPRSAGIPTDV